MNLLSMHSEWANFRGYVEILDLGQTFYPSLTWKKDVSKNK